MTRSIAHGAAAKIARREPHAKPPVAPRKRLRRHRPVRRRGLGQTGHQTGVLALQRKVVLPLISEIEIRPVEIPQGVGRLEESRQIRLQIGHAGRVSRPPFPQVVPIGIDPGQCERGAKSRRQCAGHAHAAAPVRSKRPFDISALAAHEREQRIGVVLRAFLRGGAFSSISASFHWRARANAQPSPASASALSGVDLRPAPPRFQRLLVPIRRLQ